MRQILVLEKEDRERLRRGETIPVIFGGQECGLASDERPRGKMTAPDAIEVISDNGRGKWAFKNGKLTATRSRHVGRR